MKTAVFDKEKHIIGYLEHDDEFAARQYFSMRCQPTGPWQKLEDYKPRDLRYNRRDEAPLLPKAEVVHFEWTRLAVARDDTGAHYCKVLIVDDAGKLLRLKGFKYYAEEHGEFVPSVPGRVAVLP